MYSTSKAIKETKAPTLADIDIFLEYLYNFLIERPQYIYSRYSYISYDGSFISAIKKIVSNKIKFNHTNKDSDVELLKNALFANVYISRSNIVQIHKQLNSLHAVLISYNMEDFKDGIEGVEEFEQAKLHCLPFLETDATSTVFENFSQTLLYLYGTYVYFRDLKNILYI
jgi:hypothetical protein